ncbi:FecCD family ABC transporter permease [Vibrio rumoiensis]|uniref:Iron ABC transporter permease n=1 Tax=Vibrio rumoiensis 1S-45 TaxID=1188252 RepID=A0A1E5E4C5_9VIBR|nr:iron ABC transporter permease [Vibrio rumoiensis]OEF27606.1 iron ABC transporter permease [Vibrio rumoiensis 1S-45]
MLRQFSLAPLLLFFTLLLATTAVLSITVGPMKITFIHSLQGLFPTSTPLPEYVSLIIHQVRLPRTLLCMFVGGTLGLCGAVMQGLFRNPLAEPGIIGVSSGAALGAALAIVLFSGVSANYPTFMNLAAVPIFAFIGGALTTIVVYKLGTSAMGTSVTIMLLAGVAISALSGAAIGYLNFIADDQMLRDLTLWSMGSLAGATWSGIALSAISLVLLTYLFMKQAMPLNALLLGESEAKHMGVPVQSLKRKLILLTAVGVGVTVSLSGMIGFVGLVIPHLGRMLVGPDHRVLLPVSILLGALLLTVADMFARIAVAPAELPVGIVTAIVGAPFFLYLLFQQKGKFA